MIIRVPPHFPVFAWSVGVHAVEFMHCKREHLPDLVKALERFSLDRGHWARAYSV